MHYQIQGSSPVHIPSHLCYLDKTEVIDFSILNFFEGNGEFPFLKLEGTDKKIVDLRKNEKLLRLFCGSKVKRGMICNKIKMGEKGGAFLIKFEGKEEEFLENLAKQKSINLQFRKYMFLFE